MVKYIKDTVGGGLGGFPLSFFADQLLQPVGQIMPATLLLPPPQFLGQCGVSVHSTFLIDWNTL